MTNQQQHEQITQLLGTGLEQAAEVAGARLGAAISVVQGTPPQSSSLLRFDVRFGEMGGVLSWFISNEDATGFSDKLVGGDGDRTAQLTEMHLDALSSIFSDMLEAGISGVNAGLTEPIEAGGVDMNMETRLPIVDNGGAQALLALHVEGLGNIVIVQQVDPDLAAQMIDRMPGDGATPGAEAAEASAAPATPEAAASAEPEPMVDNVVEMPTAAPAPVQAAGDGAPRDLSMLLNVPLDVTVELGKTQRNVKELLELNVGSIMELTKLAGDPMDILVNGKVLARGEVVVIDEEFGIRITEILSPEQRLRKLG